MQILQLRFKNLNSLYGEWAVDFTHPGFESEGIFAITGPTGAGKSTVLDALCLALYARTPRLSAVTKGGNEIMGRGTGECSAEVVFETPRGQFSCQWSQHRAYKKAGGKLADSRHEIFNALTGEVLETKKRETAARIEAETGMDFHRFTRSMLLAQGGFAAFLAAGPDERSPILEQITGTGIYSEISMAVHQRLREERQKEEELKGRTAGIAILSPEEKENLEAELAREGVRRKELSTRDGRLTKHLEWRRGMVALEAELDGLVQENLTLTTQEKDFESARDELAGGQRAKGLEPEFQILKAGREKRERDASQLKAARGELPLLEKGLRDRNEALDGARKKLEQAEAHRQKALEQIKKARAMDSTLDEKHRAVDRARQGLERSNQALKNREKELLQAKKDKGRLEKKLAELQLFLEKHHRDQGLTAALAGIKARVGELLAIRDRRQKMQGEWSQLNRTLKAVGLAAEKAAAHCKGIVGQEEKAQRTIARLKKNLEKGLDGKHLREYRAEQEYLLRELGHIKTIIRLEDERKKLKAGEACPLCGSLDHPFAEEQVPGVDDTEARLKILGRIIRDAETLERQISEQEVKAQEYIRERLAAETEAARARSDKELARQQMDQCEAKGREVAESMARLKADLMADLEPFGETSENAYGLEENRFEEILPQLTRRRDAWVAKEGEGETRKRELESVQADIRHLSRTVGELEEGVKEQGLALEDQEKAVNALALERRNCFGDKNPDVEEARVQTQVTQANAALETARQEREGAKEALDALNVRINTLISTSAEELKRVGALREAFEEKLRAAGFRDEADFLRHRMAPERLLDLENQSQALVDRRKQWEARRADREEKLRVQKGLALTEDPLEKLEEESASIRSSLEELGEKIGALNQKKQDNGAAEKRLEAVVDQIRAQEKECQRWGALHALIGSADGKKYRNFAQGLTFEQVVSHANRQLMAMTDRYLLVRDDEEPLALNIVDQYQAGEVRSTKNLSGGESFIVSLSLALGLSRMAGAKVRVDSLFLDEGFGTLDEEALETALDALASLRREGKIIGVISHISALKERISTQITITPESGGKSRIEGPGVRHIA